MKQQITVLIDQSVLLSCLCKIMERQMAKIITQEKGLQFEAIIIKVLLTLYKSLHFWLIKRKKFTKN